MTMSDETKFGPEWAVGRDLYRRLFLAMPQHVWLRDLEGRYLAANPAYCEFIGYPEAELIGQPCEAIFPSELADLLRAQDREVARKGAPLAYETPITGAEGRKILAEMIKVPIHDEASHVIGVLGVSRDVLRRRESEEALRLSEARYRSFFSDSRAAMILVDPDEGWILDANQAACDYYGYDYERIRRLKIWDINMLTPDEVAAEMRLAREQSRDHFYFPHRLADGTIRQVEVLSGPLTVGGQTVLYSIIHDITDQRLAEAKLAASEKLYRRVVTQVEDVIFEADAEARWTFLNPAWERITGFSVAESLGRHYLDFVHPDDHAKAIEAYARILESGHDLIHSEVRMLHKDGSYRLIAGSVRTMTADEAEGGVLLGTSGTLRDVTEKRRAEEQRRLAASVFDHAHDGIVITDAQERIMDVNDTFCRLTGYQREEVIGKTPRILRSGLQPPEFYAQMWQSLKERGHWQGEIWNRRKNGETYAELLTITAVRAISGEVSHYVGVFSDITQSKRHQQELEAAAYYDTLTGLPNRLLLMDRLNAALTEARETDGRLAIACLDLDGFKSINDRMGNRAGDKVLKIVGRRLEESLRPGDAIARLGGDEFVLLLTKLDSLEALKAELQRVLATISAPMRLGGETLEISASIGVTLYPTDGEDPDTLLRYADQAMYQAKEHGRNRFNLFDPEQGRRVKVHRDVRMQIEAALMRKELVLFYQPKVDMRTGSVLGAEALIRWNHPERGLLGPGAFLPHIENSDLIVTVGDWVLEEALRQMSEWHRQGLHMPVSVNVAPRQLQAPDFGGRLARLIDAHPELPPGILQLEVLESTALDDMQRIGEIIQECRALGVTVALDDFGTGYSTLTYLKRLPADQLKIDKSFVGDMLADPEARAIVEAVIGLADAFKRTVIAEGAETPEHCAMLMRMGCHVAQGYGIAKPMPADELPGWVEDFEPHPLWCGPRAVSA